MLIATLLTASAFVGPSSRTHHAHRTRSLVAKIEATPECAEEQKEEFFALMPSENLPAVSLDLRLFASKADDNFQAQVFARQDGTFPTWKDVGTIATTDEQLFEQAVAKQRPLIERWAYEVCNDFETNELLLDLEKPVELCYAARPPEVPFWEEKPKLKQVDVPADASFEPSLRCGFLGKTAREYRGGGVMARYERIVLGQPPAVPLPRSENWGSSGGPYGLKARKKQREAKGQDGGTGPVDSVF